MDSERRTALNECKADIGKVVNEIDKLLKEGDCSHLRNARYFLQEAQEYCEDSIQGVPIPAPKRWREPHPARLDDAVGFVSETSTLPGEN